MIKKLITLFKLGRKIAKSDILSIASKFKKPPLAITILFQLLSISFSKKKLIKFGYVCLLKTINPISIGISLLGL